MLMEKLYQSDIENDLENFINNYSSIWYQITLPTTKMLVRRWQRMKVTNKIIQKYLKMPIPRTTTQQWSNTFKTNLSNNIQAVFILELSEGEAFNF